MDVGYFEASLFSGHESRLKLVFLRLSRLEQPVLFHVPTHRLVTWQLAEVPTLFRNRTQIVGTCSPVPVVNVEP
jgi:hypothetical protein